MFIYSYNMDLRFAWSLRFSAEIFQFEFEHLPFVTVTREGNNSFSNPGWPWAEFLTNFSQVVSFFFREKVEYLLAVASASFKLTLICRK